MSSDFHTAHVNIAFDRIVRLVERWLQRESETAGGYAPLDVSARLAQRVVELALIPFALRCIRNIENGNEPVATGTMTLDLGGVLVDLATGAVRPSVGLFLRSVGEMLKHWLYVLLRVSVGRRSSQGPDVRPVTLAFGIGVESLFIDGSDVSFVRFCRQGPITPLTRAHKIFVEAPAGRISSIPKRFHYCPNPFVSLASITPLSVVERAKFAVAHVLMLGSFLRAILREPITVILARDLAYTPLVRLLDRLAAIDAVVITNSHYSSQPLWMRGPSDRRFTVHMVWYSQNVIPFVYAKDQTISDWPNYRHIAVDVSWVWTPAFAEYLDRVGVRGRRNVVGPILWYLPEEPQHAPRRIELRIAVFDVTPVTAQSARKLGVLSHYYSTETMTKFIRDIISVGDAIRAQMGIPFRILLKHKRGHQPIHDVNYQELIERLMSNGDIESLSPQTNMFAFLSNAHFAIVIPYSSPAYVASHIGKAAIYYDPTCELLPAQLAAPNVSFASGRAKLLAETLKILRAMQVAPQSGTTAMHMAVGTSGEDRA